MDLVTIAQLVAAVTNLFFVIVQAVGYHFTRRASQQTLREMRGQRTAMGRPLVIVEDYDDPPELDVAIRDVGEDAAGDITFEFSAPLENSGGFVISGLPYFRDGLDFLPPHGELSCYLNALIR